MSSSFFHTIPEYSDKTHKELWLEQLDAADANAAAYTKAADEARAAAEAKAADDAKAAADAKAADEARAAAEAKAAADAKAAAEAKAAADERKTKIENSYSNTLSNAYTGQKEISQDEIDAIVNSDIDFNVAKAIYEKKVYDLLYSIRESKAAELRKNEYLKKLTAFKNLSTKPVYASGGKSRRRHHRRSRYHRNSRHANKKSRKGRKSRKVRKSRRGFRVRHR